MSISEETWHPALPLDPPHQCDGETMEHDHTNKPCCHFCDHPLEHVFADLGKQPLANLNLTSDQVDGEKRYPLIARVCGNCLLVQVDDAVPASDIFSDYDYFSSYSDSWVAHAKSYADQMIPRLGLSDTSLVAEVASNDGYLLQHFRNAGIPVLGIDPAANVAAVAIQKGIPTEVAFFGRETGARVARQNGHADLIAANNVLAHVPDTKDFVAGFAELLAPEGVATFEFPHLLRMIERVEYDTIYHEHYFYLSLLVVERILASAGLRVFDVEELPTHGGSLRVFACHKAASYQETERLGVVRHEEHLARLDDISGYEGFASKIEAVKESFKHFLNAAKAEGRTVAAYGAAAKGNTFLNSLGIKYPDLVAVFDRNPRKQDKLTPGSHIPILPPEEIERVKPDYLVILPWNLADEISRTVKLSAWGGKFVIAAGVTRILEGVAPLL